jgi:undecaprenyl-diphosphatase
VTAAIAIPPLAVLAEHALLGTVQGITEWLPISSEGMLVLIQSWLNGGTFEDLVRIAIFLHMGTFLAALVYFRDEILELAKTAFRYREADEEQRKTLVFLVVATIVSGVLGFLILQALGEADLVGPVVTGLVGLMLIATGILQLTIRQTGTKGPDRLTLGDGVLLGLAQGLAIIPGISRSGITVSALLLRRYGKTTALVLSMLMSLPAVLGANIFLNLDLLTDFAPEMLIGLLFAFGFGLLTIHGLLKLAQRVNFALFVLLFGLLMIVAAFV